MKYTVKVMGKKYKNNINCFSFLIVIFSCFSIMKLIFEFFLNHETLMAITKVEDNKTKKE